MAGLSSVRVPSISLRNGAVALLLSLYLLLRIRSSSPSPTSKLWEQAVSTQLQHGVHSNLEEEDTRHLNVQDLEAFDRPQPVASPLLASLLQCSNDINPYIQHVRLPHAHLGISFVPPASQPRPDLRLFNPTILTLPSWSTSGNYLIVSRVVTEGLHQESLVCLADFCLPANTTARLPSGTRPCTLEDQGVLGALGGLRCNTEPIKLNVPPTPALQCEGHWSAFPDIPGFHDPRVFWSGKGEPLIILNSASQYGCVGLWIADLRTFHPELEKIVNRHGKHSGPVMSYPHLTELTRNPRDSRASVEKNWMLWFPGDSGETYVQYELGPRSASESLSMHRGLNHTAGKDSSHGTKEQGRTFAKLIGNGFTTVNLTSPTEPPCFDETHNYDSRGNIGHWHQGSNSLRLILCSRSDVKAGSCGDGSQWTADGREVHLAIMHRKFSNEMHLPMRYERYVAVWEGRRPFRMLGVSKLPFLMKNEWARPWSEDENWPGGSHQTGNWTAGPRKRSESTEEHEMRTSAYFTYTPSLAWAWRSRTEYASIPEKDHGQGMDEEDVHHLSQLGTGYLGDDVLVGIGLDDVGQAVARVKVDELVNCLRLCPGVES
jgi:hypothetical protein